MKRVFLFLFLILSSWVLQAQDVVFEEVFDDTTLRLDYVLCGDASHQSIYWRQSFKTGPWAGRKAHLSQPLLQGNGQIRVLDPETGGCLYVNSFSTLFQEWTVTEEATQVQRAFESSFQVPLPKKPVDIELVLTDTHGKVSGSLKHRVDPHDILIRPLAENGLESRIIHRGGSLAQTVDIVIVAEGYTEAQKEKFFKDAGRSADAIFSHEPFASQKERFSVRAVFAPSADSGVSLPRKGEWRSTSTSSHFDTFYTDRYLTTSSVWDVYNIIGTVPFEQIIVLANTDIYGGGGIYNSLTIMNSDHPTFVPVLVHEFGHAFGGLADEYFYDDQYETMYPSDTEPWEPNLTTLVDFQSKWADMLPAGTPVPTPVDKLEERDVRRLWRTLIQEEKDLLNLKLGVYEGGGYQSKGVYRPVQECRMKINECERFCPVCTRAILEMIAFYTAPSASTVQVHHRALPVLLNRETAIAAVTVPKGLSPQWTFKTTGLPKGALKKAEIRGGNLYVTLDGAKIRDLSRPFTIVPEAPGVTVEESGTREHRAAYCLRTAGDDGVAAYRIPGLVTTKKGTLVATYDIRHNSSFDLQEDIDIGISRSTDGGRTWGPMIVAMDMGEWGGLSQAENGIGDPCILVDEKTGDLLLFAAWAHGIPAGKHAWFAAGSGFEPETTPQLMMSRSRDDGKTWSQPVSITRQVKQEDWNFSFQGPGRGITMADGTLVVPFQHQEPEPDRTPAAGIIYSKDHGTTWHVHNAAKTNTTESQVAEVEPGVLMLNMRDNRKTGRAVSVTRDMGRTWEPHPSDGQLAEPVCMASLLAVPASQNALKQDILLFSNPADPQQRKNITIQMSLDGGVTWTRRILLDEGIGWGYSCLTLIDRETVGILYESSQAHLTFQAIKLNDIK